MKKFLILILFLSIFINLTATHNRAGEITYVQISNLTYRVTVTTFTYTLSYADRPQLNVEWGDNTSSIVDRDSIFFLPNSYKKNVYIADHTFPGPGVYKIIMQDPNRNFGIKNIPNSVNIVFSIRTLLIVNPVMGRDQTPVLLNPPYDKAAKGHIFIHNPSAFDPDGDSLSYQLTKCTRDDARDIEGYTYPQASHKFYVDSISGDLVWDTPVDTGKYNVAMLIQEWRSGRKIGEVERDMQIEVYDTKNNPPVINTPKDICIEAGKPVSVLITATDKDNDNIFLKSTSGAYTLTGCSAQFTQGRVRRGVDTAVFKWVPCFKAVRNQPYDVILKAEDDNSDLKLFDIKHFRIKVLGPSPLLDTAQAEGSSIRLKWENYGTPDIAGFNIYRREGSVLLNTDSCTAGIPAPTGFIKVGYSPGSSSVSFVDPGNGQELQFGKVYAYRIVAVFPNGTESKVSVEKKASIVTGLIKIKKVSVINTDLVNGSIYLSWARPDTVLTGGPFKYIISRAEGITGTLFQPAGSNQTIDFNDTIFVDTSINTQTSAYIYRVEIENNNILVPKPSFASSLFLDASPGDQKARLTFKRNVPWINSSYDIFRYNETTHRYDSVGTTTLLNFTDFGLVNGTLYRYLVRSTGAYQGTGVPKNLINFSETDTVTPLDNESPCTPSLTVVSQCDIPSNKVNWSIPDPVCLSDISGYKLYYRPFNSEKDTIFNITDKNIFEYMHMNVASGCYAISAYDIAGNESPKSASVCGVDSCNFYEIPNVFTPNNDTFNDRLVAKTSGLVEKVDFKLFNRGGLLLFRTSNPKIEWDGTYKGRIVSPGVYFYTCDVWENRENRQELIHKSGFVHVITEEGAKPSQQAGKK
jgi:gliding motility-associated-like protein